MNESLALLRDGPIHILVNPLAGGRRSGTWARHLQSFLASANILARFHMTPSAAAAEQAAVEAIGNGAKVLLAMGGDGTLQTLVNTPGVGSVVVGILPAGGGNDFAAALGLPRNPVEAMRAILAGRLRSVDLALARTADGRERRYCGGGGLGLDAEAAKYAGENYAAWSAKFRYVLSALRALRTFAPVTVRAEFPERDESTLKKVLVAAALNTPTYGAGLRLAANARIDDGLLDVVFIEKLPARDIASVLLQWTLRRGLRTPRISSIAAQSVVLTPDRHCLFHGDGEILGPAPVKIRVLPGALRVSAP